MRLAPLRLCLLAGSALASPPVFAQPQDEYGEEEIVVTGQKERGAVVGDVKPELQLNAGDVRALGVSSVSELLAELGPQLQSAGGGQPVVLLEGRRVASFREVGSLPAEAIARVDILPEEVALKYGYSATQKVMNIVLRQRFHGFTSEGTGKLSTQGDGLAVGGQAGFLGIRRGERVNIDVSSTHTDAILEADRGISSRGGDGTDRTLTPASQAMKVTATWAKPLSQQWLATINGEITTNQSQSLRGIAIPSVAIPAGTPYATGGGATSFYPALADPLPALRNSSSAQTGHLGLTINGSTSNWQWTLTGNYDHGRSRSIVGRPLDLGSYAAAVARGDALANPALMLDPSYVSFLPADQNRSNTDSGDMNLIASGSLFSLPAGAVSTTFKIGGSMDRVDGRAIRSGLIQPSSLSRDQGEASISIDIPLASDRLPLFGILGRLSVNGNAAVRQISDFGTLRTFGGGINWNPTRRLSLITAYRDDESAPSAAQIGQPVLPNVNFDIFDYLRGQSVRVTALTGGNAGLREASLRNLRIGGTYRLPEPDITLNVDYNRTWQRGQITALPGATPAVLAAFPERFIRDSDGNLTRVDLRPINIASEDRSQLRWGISFTKQLKTPQSQINAFREAMQRRFPNGFPGRPGGEGGPPPSGEGGSAPGGAQGSGSGGGGQGAGSRGPGGDGPRGFGPGAGGGRGGRLNFALFHTWVMSDRAVLRQGQPEIDLLDGGTIGASGGGVSRHKLEMQSGFSQSGLGLRLTGNWQSATRVDGISGFPSTTLRFDDFATMDLRLFANLGQMPKLVEKVPFLRGSRLSLVVDNVFDARQNVTDGNGVTPFAYQPYYQDAVGRSFMISFRKLFFAPPAQFRRD